MSPAFDGVPVPAVIAVTLSSVGAALGTLTSGVEAGGDAGTRVTSVTLSSDGAVVAVVPLPASSSPQATSIVVRARAARAGARGERRRRDIVAGSYWRKVRPRWSGAANSEPFRSLARGLARLTQPGGLGLAERGGRGAVGERPQLLGHAPVVAGGPQVPEQRVEPEVDALDEDERPRHGGVLRDRAGAVERVAHDGAGVLGRPRHHSIGGDGLVELREVLAGLIRRHRGVPPQQAGVLDD